MLDYYEIALIYNNIQDKTNNFLSDLVNLVKKSIKFNLLIYYTT